MIKRKLSEKEKYEKDGEWFKNMMNYFCPYSLHLDEDHQEMQVCYQVVNNDLSSFKERLKKSIFSAEASPLPSRVIHPPLPPARPLVSYTKRTPDTK